MLLGLKPIWTRGAEQRWRLASERPKPNDEPATPLSTGPDALGSDAPVRLIQWGGTLPSRRRFIQGLSVATFAALGGNLGGVTSFLLSLDGGSLAEQTKIDVVVPVLSFKRYWNPDLGVEFRYPARWLADQGLARRAAERIELENPLDLPSLKSRPRRRVDPVAAFGPPGGSGEENISVLVTPAAPGFVLSDLGSPEDAAAKLLNERIAPEGSDKRTSLIQAHQRVDRMGNVYYGMEYTVQSPVWTRHNVAVFATRPGQLYTLNAQCPETRWEHRRDSFEKTIKSFQIFEGSHPLQQL